MLYYTCSITHEFQMDVAKDSNIQSFSAPYRCYSSHNSLRGITHHPSNIFQYPSVYISFISNLKGLELLSYAPSEGSLVYNVFPSRQSLVSARFY